MRKIVLFAFALLLIGAGIEAQTPTKKETKTTKRPQVGVDGKSMAGAVMPVKSLLLPEPVVGMDLPLHEAFKLRHTDRHFGEAELTQEMLSSLLWSAYGYNRPEEKKRVAPSAVNCQEYDIYLFTRNGAYRYNAEHNTLDIVAEGDNRGNIGSQPFFATAPVVVVLVANYDRMKMFKERADRDFYAAVDGGYISQNIYLFCASAGLNTVACGNIDRDKLQEVLQIKNGRAMLAHPVGMR